MNVLPWLVFLALPTLILTNICIDVIASQDESQRQVHISGSEVSIITDEERNTFQLSDVNLKEAAKSYMGAKPDDIFLKSPTPWNDLYKSFGWKQVNRILKPIKVKILGIKYTPVIVLTQIFKNPSSTAATYKAYIRHGVEDTIASIWQTNGALSSALNISYGFDFLAMGVSGKASMTYTSKWGENVMKSQTVTVGSETGLEITLQPNQNVKAELYATRGAMTIQVDYEATLDGVVAMNFAGGYKDHHFYGQEINPLLRAGNMTTSVFSSENITLGYYSDSEIIVRDYNTNDTLYFPNLD